MVSSARRGEEERIELRVWEGYSVGGGKRRSRKGGEVDASRGRKLEQLASCDYAVDISHGILCRVVGGEPCRRGELAAAGFELLVEARHDGDVPDLRGRNAVALTQDRLDEGAGEGLRRL